MARVAPARRRSRSWIFVLLLLGVGRRADAGSRAGPRGRGVRLAAAGAAPGERLDGVRAGRGRRLGGAADDRALAPERPVPRGDRPAPGRDRPPARAGGREPRPAQPARVEAAGGDRRAVAGAGDRAGPVAVRPGDHAGPGLGRRRQRRDDDHHLARRRRAGQPGQPDLVEGAADHRHQLLDQRADPELRVAGDGDHQGPAGGRPVDAAHPARGDAPDRRDGGDVGLRRADAGGAGDRADRADPAQGRGRAPGGGDRAVGRHEAAGAAVRAALDGDTRTPGDGVRWVQVPRSRRATCTRQLCNPQLATGPWRC